MTKDTITSASTTLWHIGFGGPEPIMLKYTEICNLHLDTESKHRPYFPASAKLSAPLPEAERLIDIQWGNDIEIHHQRCGRPSDYSKDNLYITIRVSSVEPMAIKALSKYYPPEEEARGTLTIHGHCVVYRKLSDE